MVILYYILEIMCMCCGVLNFDIFEVKIMVNDKGMLVDIVICNRGIVECMIELFMLVVNEMVVEYYVCLKLLFIYCIYEEFKVEKL